MSLRGFHILFILASIAMAMGFAYWAFVQYGEFGRAGYGMTALGSALAAVCLMVYEWTFVNKVR